MNITIFILFIFFILLSIYIAFKIDKKYRYSAIGSIIFVLILTLITSGVIPIKLPEFLGGGSKFQEKYQENKINDINVEIKKSKTPNYEKIGKESLNKSLKEEK